MATMKNKSTWKKIKSKFKWKKSNSRSHRRKNSANAANTPPNTIVFPKRHKKKTSKSNIFGFGCLTTVPTERRKRNIEAKDIRKEKESGADIFDILEIVPYRQPISPSKSKSKSKTEVSSKYILENVIENVSDNSRNGNGNGAIKYNMTPTPQTLTDADLDIYDIEHINDRDSIEMELLINDKQFIEQLNVELLDYGYDNPQQLLQQLWEQQIEHKLNKVKQSHNVQVQVQVQVQDGEVFHNKYIIGHKINEGGFGSVWKIIDSNLYSKCVKIICLGNTNESQKRRRKASIREYTMTQKAFSDEIVEVELFIDGSYTMSPKAYLIMPYFEGKDLFEFIDDDNYLKQVNIQTMLHIFYKIGEKLYDLHYFKKMVHGDLKPENVMIKSNLEVEIIDFGIAKSIRNLSSDSTYLKSKGHFGTKGYVAPELMLHSKYNRKIDVFSAGVVLYNMVTECCLFPKGYKYYRLSQADYYKYLKRKFKCIKKRNYKVIDILYSCLAFDCDERLDVKQLIERYFHQTVKR